MALSKPVEDELNSLIAINTIKDYCEIVRNMKYVCCHKDQSEVVYNTIKKQIDNDLEDTTMALKYYKEKLSPLIKAIFAIAYVGKTSVRRDHLVFLGCYQLTYDNVFPPVGFARSFNICGKYILSHFSFSMSSTINETNSYFWQKVEFYCE